MTWPNVAKGLLRFDNLILKIVWHKMPSRDQYLVDMYQFWSHLSSKNHTPSWTAVWDLINHTYNFCNFSFVLFLVMLISNNTELHMSEARSYSLGYTPAIALLRYFPRVFLFVLNAFQFKVWFPLRLLLRIAGFHMTSLKFKLQNYRCSWYFTFVMYKSSWKLTFRQNFAPNEFLVLW